MQNGLNMFSESFWAATPPEAELEGCVYKLKPCEALFILNPVETFSLVSMTPVTWNENLVN